MLLFTWLKATIFTLATEEQVDPVAADSEMHVWLPHIVQWLQCMREPQQINRDRETWKSHLE